MDEARVTFFPLAHFVGEGGTASGRGEGSALRAALDERAFGAFVEGCGVKERSPSTKASANTRDG